MSTSTGRVVIFPADKSVHSEFAWQFYIDNVKKDDDKLVIVHSPEYRTHTAADKDQHGLLVADADSHVQSVVNENEAVHKLRELFEEKITNNNLKGEFCIVHHGNAGEEIVEATKQKHGDIVVMGTRSLGTLQRTFKGSVSDYVIHHSPVPVLVCRHK